MNEIGSLMLLIETLETVVNVWPVSFKPCRGQGATYDAHLTRWHSMALFSVAKNKMFKHNFAHAFIVAFHAVLDQYPQRHIAQEFH